MRMHHDGEEGCLRDAGAPLKGAGLGPCHLGQCRRWGGRGKRLQLGQAVGTRAIRRRDRIIGGFQPRTNAGSQNIGASQEAGTLSFDTL